MMDTSYCLKCKRKTKNLNSKGFLTKNKKYLVKSLCDVCKSKKKLNLFQKKMLLVFFQIYFLRFPF